MTEGVECLILMKGSVNRYIVPQNYTFYYVQKSFRTAEGKYSTKNVEKLGTLADLKSRSG